MQADPHPTTTVREFLVRLWALTRPYWFADTRSTVRILGLAITMREAWIGRILLALVIALSFGSVYVLKLVNDWNARFFNALQDRDAAAFWSELWIFSALATTYIVVVVYRLWFRQMLIIRWRRWLTEDLVRAWLADGAYYRLELAGRGTDNPEQRIEQDCATFAQQTLSLTVDLLSEVVTLVTFSVVLWSLSPTVNVAGAEVPGIMLWAALGYAVVGSWLTWTIGRRLVPINFDLERRNADFRFRMTRLRENAESVALYRGEADEERRLRSAFGEVVLTWWRYMTVVKQVTWLTTFYAQAAVIFPYVIMGPVYFSTTMPLGVLTQTAGAFGYVQTALSWFVSSFTEIAQWRAVVDRLTGFRAAIEAARQAAPERRIVLDRGGGDRVALEAVELALPSGAPLLAATSLEIRPGERVVIRGPSGSGKTTLFRALAGLWPFGTGRIVLPGEGRMLFLPQKPYLPIGTLRDTVCFPDLAGSHADDEIVEALHAVALPHLAGRLDEAHNWAMALSVGEQQRLAFARALLCRPGWLFLDEATSALDEPTEQRMYALVIERLQGATLVSVAHRPGVVAFHDRALLVDPDAGRIDEVPVAAVPAVPA